MPRQPPFHVWVDLTGTWSNPSPGLLIAWRQGRDGWEAWVISAAAHSTGSGSQVQVAQTWVPAHLVRPVAVSVPVPDVSQHRPAGGASWRLDEADSESRRK